MADEDYEIIAGHGRLAAAQMLNMTEVPAIILSHLTDAQKRLYRIADNKLTELGKWSIDALNIEFSELSALDLDVNLELTGFGTSEIDVIIDGQSAQNPQEDTVPVLTDADHVCHRGDIWKLGRHILLCGDALKAESYAALMGDVRAQMILTDPPYNVKIKTIGSLGKIKHDEFAMASGEMSESEFTDFLTTFMRYVKEYSTDGSLHYFFMDWKHVHEISTRDIIKRIDWTRMSYDRKRRFIQSVVNKVIYTNERLVMTITTEPILWKQFASDVYVNERAIPMDFITNRYEVTINVPVILRKYVNTRFDKTKNGVLTITDNNHLIVKAFATAWKYIEVYEQGVFVEDICKIEHASPRLMYKHLALAYLSPKIVNKLLQGGYQYASS